ncbi:antiterminator Q family protein [Pleionea sediminis]|uniref:antiterminator Q family protein n=1 Tax=Pleionea sediminis TaxID=2569479 RepID=UPI001185B1CE|nr:antiterminator Q family protein [Pleionea sediminis]
MSGKIKDELTRWGIWHRQGNVARHLWYSSKSPGAELIKTQSGYHDEYRQELQTLSEDEVQKLDKIILVLGRVDKNRCLVLKRKYIDLYSIRDIAEEFNLSKAKAHDLTQSAEAWVEGAIDIIVHS